jgi:hypothetical protein
METIFGSTTTIGKYAKSENDTLSIDLDEDESEVNVSPNVAESTSKRPPKKKAKVVKNEDDPLVITLKDGFKMVADALFKSGGDDDAIPDGLWDALAAINGFNEGHIAHYKLVWVSRYVEKNFQVCYNLQ